MYLRLRGEEALHIRESVAQVASQCLHDLASPALAGLTLQNALPDLPIQQDKLTVDRESGTLLRSMDALLEFCQPVGIPGRHSIQSVLTHNRPLRCSSFQCPGSLNHVTLRSLRTLQG